MKKLILKKKMKSSKFAVVFPAGKELNYFEDSMQKIFVQHPKHSNLYMQVEKSNIATMYVIGEEVKII